MRALSLMQSAISRASQSERENKDKESAYTSSQV